MSDEFETVTIKDFAKSGLGWFSVLCAVAPFFIHMTAHSSSFINDVEVVTFYRDYAAIVISPLGLLMGLIVLFKGRAPMKVRGPVGAAVLALSLFHLANGWGVFAMMGNPKAATDTPTPADDPMAKALRKKTGCDSDHIDVCEKSCADGNKVDCNELGSFFAEGTGVTTDLKRAIELFEKACNQDHPLACGNLALVLRKRVEPPEPKRALPFAEKACDLGEEDACNVAGFMYDHGEGTAEDDAKALSFFDRACKGDLGLGCRNAGLAELGKDVKSALAHFERGCELKDGSACNELGVYWDNLEGDQRDVTKAVGFFQKACDLDVAVGCNNFGLRTREDDPAGAVAAFEKSCTAKNGTGCFDLALAYDEGKGVKRDDAKAYELYEQGCKLDSMPACINAGVDLRDGDGVEKDEGSAALRFLLACSANVQQGCMLGALLTAKDDPKAGKQQLDDLCKDGFKPACDEAKKVGKGAKKGKKR